MEKTFQNFVIRRLLLGEFGFPSHATLRRGRQAPETEPVGPDWLAGEGPLVFGRRRLGRCSPKSRISRAITEDISSHLCLPVLEEGNANERAVPR